MVQVHVIMHKFSHHDQIELGSFSFYLWDCMWDSQIVFFLSSPLSLLSFSLYCLSLFLSLSPINCLPHLSLIGLLSTNLWLYYISVSVLFFFHRETKRVACKPVKLIWQKLNIWRYTVRNYKMVNICPL